MKSRNLKGEQSKYIKNRDITIRDKLYSNSIKGNEEKSKKIKKLI